MTEAVPMVGDTSADDEAHGSGETVAPEPYVLGDVPGPLDRDELRRLDAWWRAANYLAVGQIDLMANPLMREPLDAEHIKPRLLGHFGTVPGLNMVWVHANRQILRRELNAVFVAGPGHGGPGPNACAWLEGTRDGAVLPILALNQYKIANPTILARIPESELMELLRGYGYDPRVVAGDDPATVHQQLAATLDECLDRIADIHFEARSGGDTSRPAWPMIVLRTPKGWTCPPIVDGLQVEGTFRAHQVPLPAARTDPRHRQVLEQSLRSYKPEELFGRPDYARTWSTPA